MQEPFHDELAGATRAQRLSDTYMEVRERALSLPKFGTSGGAENKDIKNIARLVESGAVPMMTRLLSFMTSISLLYY